MKLFDQQAYEIHLKRAKRTFPEHAFLFQHVGEELTARLQDIKRNFKNSLNISPFPLIYPTSYHSSSLDHELNFTSNSFDLIFSCLLCHWIENLPGFLGHIHRCLEPKGLFLGALWGGSTLHELRESLLQAEISVRGGASPRISPFLQPHDATLLLPRAGFSLPVVDTERISVTYSSLNSLMKDLRGMGETNSLSTRPKTLTPRGLFEKAEEIYFDTYGLDNNRIPATFEAIYLSGWKNPQA